MNARGLGLLAGGMALVACACGSGAATDGGSSSDAATTADAAVSVGDASVLVGTFVVRLLPNSDGGLSDTTTFTGKVSDGPTPVLVQWVQAAASGDCVLWTPKVPYCSTSCGGSAACVADDTCQAYPTSTSVGTVTVTGVKTAAGASTFTSSPVVNVYQATDELAAPPFAVGDAVTVSTSGGAWAPFSLAASGIAPLSLSSAAPVLSGAAVTLTWPAGTSASTIAVKLDISHHAGSKGKIECTTADDGALTIDGALVTALVKLGVAGFPTIVVTRHSSGSAVISPGRVDLDLQSDVEHAVTVPGLQSCASNADCDGGTCQADLTCL